MFGREAAATVGNVVLDVADADVAKGEAARIQIGIELGDDADLVGVARRSGRIFEADRIGQFGPRRQPAERVHRLRTGDRKSTRLNSSHLCAPRMQSSACKKQIKKKNTPNTHSNE